MNQAFDIAFEKIFKERDDQNRVGTPVEYEKEDARKRWIDLSQDEKLDEISDYMSDKRGIGLWMEALQSDSVIDFFGRLIVKDKPEEWTW